MLFETREILHKIIDKAYPEDERIEQYKKFFLKFMDKNLKSKGGDYNLKTKTIRITGVGSKSPKDLTVVVLHELSHHIDNMQRQTSDHKAPFYAIYKKLIFAALDLGVATADDFKWVVNHGHYSDARKVMAIVNQHVPDSCELPKSLKKIYIYDCYKVRYVLKGRGYKYNNVDSAWFKEFQDSAVETELDFLTAITDKKDIDVVDAQKVHLRPHNYIIVSGNTYSCKDILKSLGYFYSAKDKKWKKEVEKGSGKI